VTDRSRLCQDSDDAGAARACLLEQARYAIEAGIDFLQVRERDLDTADLAATVSDLIALARGTRTRILVNDRVDVAMACGAAGVHLRADSVPAAAVRSIAPPQFVIGQSVHAVLDAVAAGNAVDYLIAGTVWPTSAKPAGHPVLGIDGLSDIVRATGVPVLAIGGVTLDRLGDVAARGGAGAAGIGLFMASGSGAASLPCRAVPLVEMAAAARARFDTSATAP
jgi:thiamine-phosphate pyrophosphorylase